MWSRGDRVDHQPLVKGVWTVTAADRVSCQRAAVVVTGRLELAGQLKDGQSAEESEDTDFQAVKSLALLAFSVYSYHNVIRKCYQHNFFWGPGYFFPFSVH